MVPGRQDGCAAAGRGGSHGWCDAVWWSCEETDLSLSWCHENVSGVTWHVCKSCGSFSGGCGFCFRSGIPDGCRRGCDKCDTGRGTYMARFIYTEGVRRPCVTPWGGYASQRTELLVHEGQILYRLRIAHEYYCPVLVVLDMKYYHSPVARWEKS